MDARSRLDLATKLIAFVTALIGLTTAIATCGAVAGLDKWVRPP